MLRIHLLQQWYSLSDPAMEEALIEVPTMRRFAAICRAANPMLRKLISRFQCESTCRLRSARMSA
jgi:IS5 family transposase